MTDATELDTAAIRARLEAATPAPWEVGDGWVYTLPVYEGDNRLSNVLGMKFADLDRQQQERARAQANAEFIAHARTDVERLLTALDEARAEVERLHFDLDREAHARQTAERERDAWWSAASAYRRTSEGYARLHRTAESSAVAAESALAAVRALAELVALKDGPRDSDYERRKPLAWERSRALVTDTENETSAALAARYMRSQGWSTALATPGGPRAKMANEIAADTPGRLVRRALADHFVMWHLFPDAAGPLGEWRCACGLKFGFSDTAIDHQRDAVLAALATPTTTEEPS